MSLTRFFYPAANDCIHARMRMIEDQIQARGVTSSVVLEALRRVPRHEFVPDDLRDLAYADHPLPIGYGQTISQPYIVALMTELLELKRGHKVLEVGTGSGYQAAVLAQITPHVFTVEIVKPLAEAAQNRLAGFGLDASHVIHSDGCNGLEREAPFDAIIVTAAAERLPQPLVEQLRVGGRMVIPIGAVYAVQKLTLLEKGARGKIRTREILPVSFVPITGGAKGDAAE